MPESAEPLVPRKRPTQERSKRKFQAMLEAARELLIDVGFESLTCEEIATRAEVPIGTLYQYFANKYVIVCELDRQDTVGVREELAAFAPTLSPADPTLPLVSNAGGEVVTSGAQYLDAIVTQVASPVEPASRGTSRALCQSVM